MAGDCLIISGTSDDAPVLLLSAGSVLVKYPAILQHAQALYADSEVCLALHGGTANAVYNIHQSLSNT